MTQRIVDNFVPGRIPSSTKIALGMFVGTSVHGNRFMLREGLDSQEGFTASTRLRRSQTEGWEAMLEFDPKLDLRVSGNAITLALLGTRYSVTYFKRRGSPGLFAKDILHEVIRASQWPSAEFLAKAWKVANDKARELGWIVWERRLRPHILSFMMAGECRQGIVTC